MGSGVGSRGRGKRASLAFTGFEDDPEAVATASIGECSRELGFAGALGSQQMDHSGGLGKNPGIDSQESGATKVRAF